MSLTLAQATAPPEAMPATPADSDNLYCIVHHGPDDDPFWMSFNSTARVSAVELGLANVEIHGRADIAEQAAAIIDCVDRGAVGIASSIPDLDGLRDALIAARTSGASLFTFNSGAGFAGQAGATFHYALDERKAGELAGREFNAAGATGTVLCALHEEANIGLEERCDGLAGAYGGAVERVQLPAGSLTDPMVSGRALGAAIAAHQADGVLVLNPELVGAAIGAVKFLGAETLIGSIGTSGASIVLVDQEQLLFAIGDGRRAQASHVVLAFKNADSSANIQGMLTLWTSQAADTTTLLIQPLVFNRDYIDNLPDGWQQQICDLTERMSPERVPAFCNE